MKDLVKVFYEKFNHTTEFQDDVKEEAIKEFRKEISNMSDEDLVGHLQDVRYSIINNRFTFLFDFVADKE